MRSLSPVIKIHGYDLQDIDTFFFSFRNIKCLFLAFNKG